MERSDVQLSALMGGRRDELRAVLVKHIHGMLLYFGYDVDAMSGYQVAEIVDDILEKYWYFRLADVSLCFKKARMESGYGNFYGRVSGKVIMGWFARYDRERDEVLAMMPMAPMESTLTGDVANEVMSREEYEEIRLAKAAGGDMDAYGACIAAERNRKMFWNMRYEVGNYKYNTKHRYDKRDDMLAQGRKKKGSQGGYP